MADNGAHPQWHESLYRWLSAPLLVTIVGAVLINFVIPEVTKASENHQRALDVKTALVGDMSDAITKALMTGRLVATDVIPKTGSTVQGPFNAGLQAWQEQQAKIGTELEAYFPNTGISGGWRQYGEIVTNVYFLSATGVEDRATRIEQLRNALRARGWCAGVGIDWGPLTAENERTPRSTRFHQSYVALDGCVLGHGDDLVQAVLSRTPSGF